MSLPEFTTQIHIPKWQLKDAAGHLPSTPHMKLLIEIADQLAESRRLVISNVICGESGDERSSLFMHPRCLVKFRTPTLPEGANLSLDDGRRICIRPGKGMPVKLEAQEIFEDIVRVFTFKVAQSALARMKYETDLALEFGKSRWPTRVRVRGILKSQKEATSPPNRSDIPQKEIYIIVLPTTNVHILFEGFGREEQLEQAKELKEYFELGGLVLREITRSPSPRAA